MDKETKETLDKINQRLDYLEQIVSEMRDWKHPYGVRFYPGHNFRPRCRRIEYYE